MFRTKLLTRTVTVVTVFILALSGVQPAFAAPPANDNFADAASITTMPFNATVDMTDATIEPGEPQDCEFRLQSVWYAFTPAEDMTLRADMSGSAVGGNVSIFLAAGSSISDLISIACANSDVSTNFLVQAGQTYYLQVGSYGQPGVLQINLEQITPPANDNFANATPISALPFSATVDNTDATVESGEPPNCSFFSFRSVWYAFTPAEDMTLRADMSGSAVGHRVSIYLAAGSSISDLTSIACETTYTYDSTNFQVQAGQTYYLQVDSLGQPGVLQINMEQITPPVNDNFANATPISALPFDDAGDTILAGLEPGEPTPSCAYYGQSNNSVWYAFAPSTNGAVSASIPIASFSPVFAVYTGDSFASLTELGCQNYSGNLLSFSASAGMTYYFQIGNLYPWEQGGSIQFHLNVAPPPDAGFYFYPNPPSVFDSIQFSDSSYDPAGLGFQSFTWDFGDGTTSTDQYPTHKYAVDGDYTVQHAVTTIDGRSASTSQLVQVHTHDVTLTEVKAPESAKVGKSEKIIVSVVNSTALSETVRVDLYRSVAGGGFEFVTSLTKISSSNRKGDKPTKYTFSYTFTSEDAAIGKVIFRAVATIENAPDAFPQDNERLSSLTIMKQK